MAAELRGRRGRSAAGSGSRSTSGVRRRARRAAPGATASGSPARPSASRLRGVTSRRRWIGRALGALRALELTWVCCGVDYPKLVEGEADYALYRKAKPWDHAPGSLLLDRGRRVRSAPSTARRTAPRTSRRRGLRRPPPTGRRTTWCGGCWATCLGSRTGTGPPPIEPVEMSEGEADRTRAAAVSTSSTSGGPVTMAPTQPPPIELVEMTAAHTQSHRPRGPVRTPAAVVSTSSTSGGPVRSTCR